MPTSAATLLAGELRTVIVGRIAVDRVDVIDAALLRHVFDHQRGTLDAEVRGTAVRDWPATAGVVVHAVPLGDVGDGEDD